MPKTLKVSKNIVTTWIFGSDDPPFTIQLIRSETIPCRGESKKPELFQIRVIIPHGTWRKLPDQYSLCDPAEYTYAEGEGWVLEFSAVDFGDDRPYTRALKWLRKVEASLINFYENTNRG